MCISVLISIYDGEKPQLFQSAMESIWDHQTLKPKEIVLVKDGGLNTELEKITHDWKEKLGDKLKVVSLPKNAGLAKALNEGMKHCSCDLVARMDTDDISMPQRLEIQFDFMEKNPDIAVSSGFIKEIDKNGKTVSVRKLPLTHEELITFARTRSPVSHAAAIFRKSAVLAVGGYPPFKKAQDHALWSVMLLNGYKFANVDAVLYAVPVNGDFFKKRGFSHLVHELAIIRYQRKIGFIGFSDFVKNIIIRVTIRLSPTIIKKIFYKYARG